MMIITRMEDKVLRFKKFFDLNFPKVKTFAWQLLKSEVSVSAMLVYIHQKNIAQVFILERYFFVSIYPAAIPCTYLAVFLATALPLCL